MQKWECAENESGFLKGAQNAISGKAAERAFFEKMEVKSHDFFKKWDRNWADGGRRCQHILLCFCIYLRYFNIGEGADIRNNRA